MAVLFTSPPKAEETKTQDPQEPVWTYRGYRLKTSEFVTAMVHLFRAEIQRANVWRQRLDTTTNWAVVATGATLSIAFSQPNIHHGIIILHPCSQLAKQSCGRVVSSAQEILGRGFNPLAEV